MSRMETALKRFAQGEFLIVTDDVDRENEADLILLAEAATAEKLAFMIRHTSGVICATLTAERAAELDLPLMVRKNRDSMRTAFTVSVDLKHGITTGISAAERAATLKALSAPEMRAEDFNRPGHIFPLIARPGGVRERRGHTEAATDLAKLVGGQPCGVLSELVNDDGTMMRGDQLHKFADQHGLAMISIAELIEYLGSEVELVKREELVWAKLPRQDQEWQIATYVGEDGAEHAILKYGSGNLPLVRIHSECVTGDVFASQRCDCGPQLEQSMDQIAKSGYGYVIYLRDHEGRGIGLAEKVRAYLLQDRGLDTVDANLELGHPIDAREWQDVIEIVKILGLNQIQLLTNNPEKISVLRKSGIDVERIPLALPATKHNEKYLQTKRDRLGHLLAQVGRGE